MDNPLGDLLAFKKIKSALNLLQKYEILSNFTLQIDDMDQTNLYQVMNKYTMNDATFGAKSSAIWVITDKLNTLRLHCTHGNNSDVYFLIPKGKLLLLEVSTGCKHFKELVIKTFPEKLSVLEITNSFIGHILKRILPDNKVPEQIYNHLFTSGEVEGSFLLDSNCREAIFIASESNGNTLAGRLNGPRAEFCSTSLKQRDLSSSCSVLENDSLMSFKIAEGNWTRGQWRYKVDVTSYDSISVIVICSFHKSSLRIMPRLFSKSSETTNTINASVKNNIIVLAAAVMYEGKPVLNASVYANVNSELLFEENESSILLHDDGIGLDLTKNDGIYTNEFHNFKGNGQYSFSFIVNINGSSVVLKHRQLLKIDDKNIPVVLGNGRKMPYPTFLIRNDSTLERLLDTYGEPKSEFSYEELRDTSKVDSFETLDGNMHIEDQERISESLSVQVIKYKKDIRDLIDPGQVTDLKVIDMSYTLSSVTLEWTSVGDDETTGTAARIDLKYTTDGSIFPWKFHDSGLATLVSDSRLMDGSSLQPLRARMKHKVTIKVENAKGLSYPEDIIYFFALAYTDEANNKGLVSNVAYAFFKPAKYSDEIKEIHRQHRSGGLIILVFLFFIACLGVFICAVKWYHKQRQQGFSPEQILKYSQ